MNNEIVTVIVPVYNVEKYISECIKSIVEQTYTKLDIILVDDGSTDNSGLICDEYKGIDDRIRVVHKKNGGAASAKNVGLDLVKGNYVCFVDSDDFLSKDYVEKLLKNMIENNSDISECLFFNLYKDEKLNESFYSQNRIFSSEQYLEQYIKDWKSSLFWNKLFKANVINNIRFKKERRCIDDEFFTYKVILNSKRVSKLDEPIYFYRQRKSSAINNSRNNTQKVQDSIDILIERYSLVTNKYPKLKKEYIDHDICYLYYIVNDFILNKHLKKSLKKVASFYLKEAIKSRCDLLVIYNALLLLVKRTNGSSVKTDVDNNQYFD